MQPDGLPHNLNPVWLRLRHKLVSSYVLVTLSTVLLAGGIALAASRLFAGGAGEKSWGRGLRVVLGIILLAAISFLIGLWISRPLDRRLQRVFTSCRAWLRGNLSLRIGDPVPDDLGLLAEQLDTLAEHLEQDEQDLAELREYNMRITDQVRALAVDEERERLARELHDGVKQHLFSLSMTASAIRTRLESEPATSTDVREMVQEVETTSKTVQRELTRLIEDLSPGTLEEKGLAAALNDYTLLFGAREHILAHLDVQGNDALLTPPIAESLYRVAQEALHNVARHARATRVDVRLRCLPEEAMLTLSDNGIGFDPEQVQRGLGLGNMQDRMMSIGGRLTIESKASDGTTIRAEVGLTQPLNPFAKVAGQERERPNPRIENWGWLGQRLVIPVGQTWPWLPADQVHLYRPLVEAGEEPLYARPGLNLFGQQRVRFLAREAQGKPWLRIRHHRSGYTWRSDYAKWTLETIRGPGNATRAALMRNGQPLAAMQAQGRLLSRWTEIVYGEQGYRLAQDKDHPGAYQLTDQSGEEIVSVKGGPTFCIELSRAIPLPLLVMVILQVGTEAMTPIQAREAVEPIS